MSLERRGRPRSETARQAILDATHDLIVESGYDRLTVSGIAVRAGVGKQTIYRWWPDRAAIVAECVISTLGGLEPIAVPHTGAVAADLRSWVKAAYAMLEQSGLQLVRALTVAAIEDEDVSHRVAKCLAVMVHGSLSSVLAQGASERHVRRDISLETAADVLVGAMVVAIISRRAHSEARADELADLMLLGLIERVADDR